MEEHDLSLIGSKRDKTLNKATPHIYSSICRTDVVVETTIMLRSPEQALPFPRANGLCTEQGSSPLASIDGGWILNLNNNLPFRALCPKLLKGFDCIFEGEN
jgi:hypothetical protein